jgi:hypothetical protein
MNWRRTVANFPTWPAYGWRRDLRNEADFPIVVWAYERKQQNLSTITHSFYKNNNHTTHEAN